jgi:hypothetical protein
MCNVFQAPVNNGSRRLQTTKTVRNAFNTLENRHTLRAVRPALAKEVVEQGPKLSHDLLVNNPLFSDCTIQLRGSAETIPCHFAVLAVRCPGLLKLQEKRTAQKDDQTTPAEQQGEGSQQPSPQQAQVAQLAPRKKIDITDSHMTLPVMLSVLQFVYAGTVNFSKLQQADVVRYENAVFHSFLSVDGFF